MWREYTSVTRSHRAVRKLGLAVHSDVQLHADVSLLALTGLMHLWAACRPAFFVELGAPIMVAFAMVTVLTLVPLAFSSGPTLENMGTPSLLVLNKAKPEHHDDVEKWPPKTEQRDKWKFRA